MTKGHGKACCAQEPSLPLTFTAETFPRDPILRPQGALGAGQLVGEGQVREH